MVENNIKHNIVVKLFFIYGLVVVAVIAVVMKIIYLQGHGEEWEAKSNSMKEAEVKALRGDICAADGRILATSMPFYSVHWDMSKQVLKDTLFNNNIDSLSACLSRLFKDKSKDEYAKYFREKRTQKSNRFVLVRNKVTFTQVAALKKFPIFNRGKNKGGLIIERSYNRTLPHKSLAARTIGKPGDHKYGMEASFDEILAGHDGVQLMARLPSGDYHATSSVDEDGQLDAEDGKDVISTINVNIQDIAEQNLMNQLVKNNAKHGTVIVMEVKTGKIRAMANIDMNADGTFSENYNYAVGNLSEPGSTFKLASLITVFEKTGADIDDTILTPGNGQFEIPGTGHIIRDDHDAPPKMTIREAFEHSSNVGVARLIYNTYQKNQSEFIDRLDQMHLEKLTEIDIPGEPIPDFKYPGDKDWWGTVSLTQISIGYEVRLTPLQTLTFYNAVANDGVMVRPHILEAVRTHGEIERVEKTEVLNSAICSKSTLEKVKILLKGVVENGTAKNIRSKNYQIAGKTGTAQIANANSGYVNAEGDKSYLASFVGYFPADKPKYSCIVVINSPKKDSYYGSAVAGPVFKAISDKLYSQDYDLQSDNKEFDLLKHKDFEKQNPYSKSGDRAILDRLFSKFNIQVENSGKNTESQFVYTDARSNPNAIHLDPVDTRKGIMPDVTGMGLRDALCILRNRGLVVTVVGRGAVKTQSIPMGSSIKSGTKVVLELK